MASVWTASQCGSTAMGHGQDGGRSRCAGGGWSPPDRPPRGRSGRNRPAPVRLRRPGRRIGLADHPGQGSRAEHPVHRDVGAVQRAVEGEHLAVQDRADTGQPPAGRPDRPRRPRRVDGEGQQHPVATGDRGRLVDQRPVGAAGRGVGTENGMVGPVVPHRACRRRGGRTRSTGSGARRTPRGPGPTARGPRRRSGCPGRPGPSRAKLWPRTASTAVAVRDGAVDHARRSRRPMGRDRTGDCPGPRPRRPTASHRGAPGGTRALRSSPAARRPASGRG